MRGQGPLRRSAHGAIRFALEVAVEGVRRPHRSRGAEQRRSTSARASGRPASHIPPVSREEHEAREARLGERQRGPQQGKLNPGRSGLRHHQRRLRHGLSHRAPRPHRRLTVLRRALLLAALRAASKRPPDGEPSAHREVRGAGLVARRIRCMSGAQSPSGSTSGTRSRPP